MGGGPVCRAWSTGTVRTVRARHRLAGQSEASMIRPSLRSAVSVTAAIAAVAGFLSVMAGPSTARADEGMWTFDNFPIQTVNQKYGTRIDQAWLDRVRNA